ncbi:unnamed protein product [Owenia fusiformis]|uniref:Uncharacterized protein n=1 Tax=Owenia fusiformis TaxID=6347 RepID=A0A8S4Q1P6_OWEFU|nr:unnamed protein product [Owenia fusiformis]
MIGVRFSPTKEGKRWRHCNDVFAAMADKEGTNLAIAFEHGAHVNTEDDIGNIALLIAAFNDKDDARLRLLLEHGADVNAKDGNGNTAFIIAAWNDKDDTRLRLLLEHGADINAKDGNGNTALIIAARKDKDGTRLRLLLEHGADINAKDDDGDTALIIAARNDKDDARLRLLLEHGADINAKDGNGNTALFIAARYDKDVTRLRLLLEHGADVNAQNNYGNTALIIAARNEKDDTRFRLLLEHGADVNAKDDDGDTALIIAARYDKDVTRLRLLLEHGADVNAQNNYGNTALIIAARNEKDDTRFRLLLEQGADVNAKDGNGNTALFIAAKYHKDDTRLRLLLEHGADVNAKDGNGDTALIIAALNVKDDTPLRLLLEHGADVNAKDGNGNTALFIAAKYHKDDTRLRLLLEHGADVNAKDGNGDTALIIAALNDKDDTPLRLLLEHGADVNDQNNDGNTALIIAARNDKDDTRLRLLLEHGADVNSKDGNGNTALIIAARNDNDDPFLRLLLEHGADVNAKNNAGDTALIIAAEREQPEYVEALLDHGANIKTLDTREKSPLTSINISSPKGLKIYSLLYTRGAKDDNYQHLMSLNENATNDQQHETRMKLDRWNEQSRLSLKYLARHVLYMTFASNKQGYVSTIQFLIDNGQIPSDQKEFIMYKADIKEVLTILDEMKRKTALLDAIMQNDLKYAWCLIKEGHNINARNNNGKTPLILAVEQDSPPIARFIIGHRADVNVKDKFGNSPLTSIKRSSSNAIHLYCLLTIFGAEDRNYQHLMSMYPNATAEQKHEAIHNLEQPRMKSKSTLRQVARQAVFDAFASNKRGYASTIEESIKSGRLRTDEEAFMFYNEEMGTMSSILDTLKRNDEREVINRVLQVNRNTHGRPGKADEDDQYTFESATTGETTITSGVLNDESMVHSFKNDHNGEDKIANVSPKHHNQLSMREQHYDDTASEDGNTGEDKHFEDDDESQSKFCDVERDPMEVHETNTTGPTFDVKPTGSCTVLDDFEVTAMTADSLNVLTQEPQMVLSTSVEETDNIRKRTSSSEIALPSKKRRTKCMDPEPSSSSSALDDQNTLDVQNKDSYRSRLSSSSSSDEYCPACEDSSSNDVCNISISDLQRIHRLEGVHRYGMKPKDLRYTIYLKRDAITITSLRTDIERDFPNHKFIFDFITRETRRGHKKLAGIHRVGSASSGTLGGLIKVTTTQQNIRTYALTCRHVISTSKVDDDIYICRSVTQSNDVLMKPIGKLRTYVDVDGRLGHGNKPRKRRQTYDIAIIEIHPDSIDRNQYRQCAMMSHNTLKGKTDEFIKVQKTGCKTSCTYGIITDKCCAVDIDYIDVYGKEQTASLHGVIEIAKDLDINFQGHFAESGDSGAIIVAKNVGSNNYDAIGMFTFFDNISSDEDNESRAYAFPIKDALDHQFKHEPGILGGNSVDSYCLDAYVGL